MRFLSSNRPRNPIYHATIKENIKYSQNTRTKILRKSTSFILHRASKTQQTKWRLSNTLYNELNERYKTADRRLSWIYRIIWNYEWEPTYRFHLIVNNPRVTIGLTNPTN